MQDRAIVLKNSFPKKNKLILLHESLGKISIFFDEKHSAARLCNGSLVYCSVLKKQSSFRCEQIEAYFIPMTFTLSDLSFMHDILKICLQFLPEQTSIPDLFELIVAMYSNLEHLPVCLQNIYLLRIFLYVGIFPENKKLYQSIVQQYELHNHDSDIMLQQGVQYCWKQDANYS